MTTVGEQLKAPTPAPEFKQGDRVVVAAKSGLPGILSSPPRSTDGKVEVMWLGGSWPEYEDPSTLRLDTGQPTLTDLRKAIHQGLAPNWMVLLDALGGTKVAYDALLGDVAASVLDTLNGGDRAAHQR